MFRSFTILGLILLLLNIQAYGQEMQTQTYAHSDENFPNPERGFFITRIPLSLEGEREPLTDENLDVYREQGITLMRAYYLIDQYRERPLDDVFFEQIEADITAARAAGFKLIPRFAYNFPTNDDYEQSRDASLEWVLTHIEQLSPVLQEHADVVAHLEAGFIGAWGEWHSSSNGLIDTPVRGVNEATSAVLDALLNALPETRQIALRYPLLKQQLFGMSPLDETIAYSGNAQARIGAHEDCFLASDTNWGTYLDADVEPQIEAFKTFLSADNRFVVQSGETCNADEEAQPYIGCENAMLDLERLHWSSINIDYHEDVLDLWHEEGCFEAIARRLGYRLVLEQAQVPRAVEAGKSMTVELEITNEGFASPYNARDFVLLLCNDAGDIYLLDLAEMPDPRWWQAGEMASLVVDAVLPDNVPIGEYELLLSLPDPMPGLADDPRYAIRLANEGLWEESMGYHRLNLWIVVSA